MKEISGRILIVDDTPENIDVLNNLLKNHKRIIALSGNDALKILDRGTKPDLILLDIIMPGLDGFETCRRIKENPETADIPIIFMTSLDDTVNKVKGFEFGAVDYVTKPFEPLELLKRVETHLKIRGLQSKLENQNQILEQKVKERTRELQEMNIELKKAKEKAEASDKLKGEFLAQISHEIRTPLNAIVSMASLLVEEYADDGDEDLYDIVNGIQRGINRITRTVDLILNYSDIINGTYTFSPSKVNIYDVVIENVSLLKELAKKKNLELIINKQSELIVENIDPYSVLLITKNIIENAIIFTDKGKVELVLKEENGKKIFECIDTGRGISEKYLPEIFEPFTQEEQGYTRSVDGNGLGLPLAKKHCEINNIELEIETEKGKGSTFRLIFP